MKVLINEKEYSLTEINKFGGEGELYKLNFGGESKCVKIYYPEKRTSFNERKIHFLINRFKHLSLAGIENYIAYPEIPVYEIGSKRFCGFLMKYFDNHDFITDYKFSNNKLLEFNTSSFDEARYKLFDNLFFYVKVLHKAGIILGDINFDNILIDKNAQNPFLVDIDSVQVGPFFSNTKSDDFIDPSVKIDGYKTHKYFIYTTESDIYSLAAIFYEMVVGSPPHYYQTKYAVTTLYKKNIDLSFIDYFLSNSVKLNQHSHEIWKDDEYYVFLERLFFLQKNYPTVFNYFKSTFSEGKRYYFYYKQNRPVNIHKKDGVLEFKEVELITQSKEDPDELELFIKQFELRIP